MDTETVRLNITLPSSLARELNRVSKPRKRSQFVAEAIKLRIKMMEQEKLNNLLAEGYKAEKENGLAISKEFEASDLEGWGDY